ncbi:hypothetical protein AVEN_45767-1 [Araneus ventricosus]|uniref:Uncharacterized protein n=1 Tax=Araneus ventricosus TaxID=182803 RepID=A0A4Y2W3J0_ARAVE|nr:hypothetical protein AVEN_45767-1 [Araneus ventricosus]
MVSSTHAFRFCCLGFRGTIAACELKHRSGSENVRYFQVIEIPSRDPETPKPPISSPSSLLKPYLPALRGVAEEFNLNDLCGCRTNHPTTNMRFPSRLIIGKGQNVTVSLCRLQLVRSTNHIGLSEPLLVLRNTGCFKTSCTRSSPDALGTS